MSEDHYATLGINRSASTDEIHEAYRNLARRYHPDLNPDNEEAKGKFQELQKAYEVLKDPKKREMFDQYGPSFESMGTGEGAGPWRAHPGSGGNQYTEVDLGEIFGDGMGGGSGSFSDLFRQFTRRQGPTQGQRKGRARSNRGTDIAHDLQIPFGTAVAGGTAQLSVRRHTGKVEVIDVKIPVGIEDGRKIRLRGQGDAGPPGGKAGDILITIRVAPHPCFQRQGRDLIVKVPVTLKEALLGAKIDVPTPKGVVTLTIPSGTSSGRRLRIKGHGVASDNGDGDLFAELQIVVPESIDTATQEAIKKLDLEGLKNPRENLVW